MSFAKWELKEEKLKGNILMISKTMAFKSHHL
jgi:hypothetical protein